MLHVLVFSLATSGMLGGLYTWLLARQDERLDAAIGRDTDLLRQRLAALPPGQMAAVVERVTLYTPGATTVVMVASDRFEWIAGNLRRWPGRPGAAEAGKRLLEWAAPLVGEGAPGGRDDLLEFPLGVDPATGTVRARVVTLPGGRRLLVGRNLAAHDEFRALVGRVFLAALALTVTIGVAGGALLSRRVSARLDQINRESEAILAGALDRRMPGATSDDEFGELSANLNNMLDRIAAVMEAMRAVSDEIAHDLRSPLTRLRGRLELALIESGQEGGAQGASGDAGRVSASTATGTARGIERAVVEAALGDVDRVLFLIDEILTIALAESGLPSGGFEEIELEVLARGGCELYEPLAEEAGLTLELGTFEGARLRGHRELLSRALGNLLDNALKYVPRGGRIVVTARARVERIEFVVADDGPGIPEIFRNRALERFSRLDPSRSTPGSGLGLSLVRAVAVLHGGTVRLEDAAPGLRVVLDLPAGERPA